MASSAGTVVDEILGLLRCGADVRLDEPVSQLDHALQTAALAEAAGASAGLVAAALLHDIGHLLAHRAHDGSCRPGSGGRHHEAVAARYLAPFFGSAVTAPIALHVRAKRYLCAVEPAYVNRLTPASRWDLAAQGGPLSAHGVDGFEDLPWALDALALRRFDDAAKTPGSVTADLEGHRRLLESLVTSHLRGRSRAQVPVPAAP
ncbi:MAG: HD domain-containing protein [Acidimicrobiales bacterium]